MKKIEQTLELARVAEHRREDCANYTGCLHEASALLWPSFSCKNCDRYIASSLCSIESYERNASPLAWDI
jgi:hypothetical protein